MLIDLSSEEELVNYSTADYSKILDFVLAKNVYRSRLDKKLIGHAEAKNPEKNFV